MNHIKYIKGDATSPQAKGTKIIAHICNNLGGWGKGFVLAVSKRWKAAEIAYRKWHRERAANNFLLGQIQLVQVESHIYVANMLGQQGYKHGSKGAPVRYAAIDNCLRQLATEAEELKASVHMPRIGTGLAGGKWDKIEPMIQEHLIEKGIEVWVYDFN